VEWRAWAGEGEEVGVSPCGQDLGVGRPVQRREPEVRSPEVRRQEGCVSVRRYPQCANGRGKGRMAYPPRTLANSFTSAHTRAHTHTHTHAQGRAHTHSQAHTPAHARAHTDTHRLRMTTYTHSRPATCTRSGHSQITKQAGVWERGTGITNRQNPFTNIHLVHTFSAFRRRG